MRAQYTYNTKGNAHPLCVATIWATRHVWLLFKGDYYLVSRYYSSIYSTWTCIHDYNGTIICFLFLKSSWKEGTVLMLCPFIVLVFIPCSSRIYFIHLWYSIVINTFLYMSSPHSVPHAQLFPYIKEDYQLKEGWAERHWMYETHGEMWIDITI